MGVWGEVEGRGGERFRETRTEEGRKEWSEWVAGWGGGKHKQDKGTRESMRHTEESILTHT
jgi:hypothetical protein